MGAKWMITMPGQKLTVPPLSSSSRSNPARPPACRRRRLLLPRASIDKYIVVAQRTQGIVAKNFLVVICGLLGEGALLHLDLIDQDVVNAGSPESCFE